MKVTFLVDTDVLRCLIVNESDLIQNIALKLMTYIAIFL